MADIVDVKGALQSRTVWLGIIGFVVSALKLFGIELGVDPAFLTDNIVMLITAVTSLGAVVFRVLANTKISGILGPKQ